MYAEKLKEVAIDPKARTKSYREFVRQFAGAIGAINPVSEAICNQLLALLVRRIHPNEGRQLIAQLPRGFQQRLRPELQKAPDRNIRQEDFKNVITDLLPETSVVDWLLIARKFGRHLYQHVSTGEMDQVRSQLPNAIDRILFTPEEEDGPQFERKALWENGVNLS